MSTATATTTSKDAPLRKKQSEPRSMEALKQLFCGGVAGSAAKTVTAPLSRLTILFQVHSMVTTRENRPKYATTSAAGVRKIIERGGMISLWKGNGTSVLHRFPFSAINFYCYEYLLDMFKEDRTGEENDDNASISTLNRFIAGATAGCAACVSCYPLDLVRTRLTTELPGREHYKGITDAFGKILQAEGPLGLYSGIGPTLFVAVPSFAISYTVYGSLKEYCLEDELFYNLRRIDDESGELMLGFRATLMCGATSGFLATIVTFPFDTIRRRMQIQNLHIPAEHRLTGRQQFGHLIKIEGVRGIYRGLAPELAKVVPMVGTLFLVYEYLKNQLKVGPIR